jgi:hypothetical protein
MARFSERLDFSHLDWIVYLAAFQRALHLCDWSDLASDNPNSCLARTAGDDHNWAIFECDFGNFFSSPSPVSFLRYSHIAAPGFIQFGGRFGWRRFQ